MLDLSRYQVGRGAAVEISFGLGNHPEVASGIQSRRTIPKCLLSSVSPDTLQAVIFGFSLVFSHMRGERSRVDLVHVHGDVMEIVFAWLVSKLYRAKLIATIHAGLSHKTWYRAAASWIFTLPDSVICVSPDIEKQVREFVTGITDIYSIPSGIHRETYTARERFPHSVPFQVLSVGRLHSMKGYSYLIEAVADEKLRGKIRLTLVGDGPDRGKLEKLAQRTGANVRFLGRKSKSGVIRELHQSNLFVSCSVQLGEQTEGTPTVVMEAMAAGLPVIITDVGGAKFIVKDIENGFVIPPGESAALINILERVIDDPLVLAKQSRNNIVESAKFDWNVIGSRINKVYESTLNYKSFKEIR